MNESNKKRIFRTTNTLALILSVSVAVLLPLGYFVLSYQYQSAVLETEAEAGAYFVSQLINANPEFWRYSQHRLEETLSHHLSKKYGESRQIVDLDDKVIASITVPLQLPVMVRSHDLFDSGAAVARIEVISSIKPLLNSTVMFGAIGIFLGSVGFVCFRIFPLRALSDTLKLLYESEEKFRAITTTAVDGIIVMDSKGMITYWNPAAERLFGHSKQEALGQELHMFLAPQKYYGTYKHGFDNFVKAGQGAVIGKTIELTALKKGGIEFPIEVSTSAIMIKDEWHAVGLIHDITDRKSAEKDLAEMYVAKRDEAEISTSLLQFVEALSANLEEKDLIRNMLDLAPGYLKFNRISLFIQDDEAESFAFAGAYGLSHAEKELAAAKAIRPGDFPAVDILMKGECVIIDKAVECDLVSADIIESFNMNSALLVPISFRGKTSGIICGIYTSGQPIEQKDRALLKGLADGLGIALQNSRLYKESNDRLAELTNKVETIKAMGQLDREILSTIDRSEILKSAAVLTSRLIPCDRVAVLLRNGSTYSVVTEWGAGRFMEVKYDISRSHFNIIESRQASLSIPDLSKDNVDCTYHKDQRSIGIKSSFVVPLINKGEVMGTLDIGSLEYGKLTSSHLSTAEKIAAQITVALENARLYEDLEHLLVNTITSLAHTIDAKSPWTKGHSERVTGFAVEIAKEMGLKEKDINHIKLCGILHDIGKIGTYDVVLDKPGKLTDEEFALVKKHPEKGAEILAPIKQLKDIVPGILYHHERYDGKGYPFGIKGDDIPLCASILSVADSFDSMTADRPYRKSPGIEYAIAELKRCSGSQFNPRIVEVFLSVLKKLHKPVEAQV
jgi:PAS domain S-box-containing protein/putative nucleotidyltransferase with HDIG domain